VISISRRLGVGYDADEHETLGCGSRTRRANCRLSITGSLSDHLLAIVLLGNFFPWHAPRQPIPDHVVAVNDHRQPREDNAARNFDRRALGIGAHVHDSAGWLRDYSFSRLTIPRGSD